MPTIDLAAYAAELGDVTKFFVNSDGRSHALVVENATGEPKFTISPDGKLSPYSYHPLGDPGAGLHVVNPPGFTGFPDHDRDNPAFDPNSYTSFLGDPSQYFTHFDAEHPLLVRHSDGMPTHKIINGSLIKLGG